MAFLGPADAAPATNVHPIEQLRTDSSVRIMSRFSLLPTDFVPSCKATGDRTG